MPKEYKHGSEYKDVIWNQTMSGFPSFSYQTHHIGGTTYLVSCIYSASATQTMEEALTRSIMHDLGLSTSSKETRKLLQKYHDEIALSDEKERARYRKKFEEIGFTEDEIKELMQKIDEHLQTRHTKYFEMYHREWAKD